MIRDERNGKTKEIEAKTTQPLIDELNDWVRNTEKRVQIQKQFEKEEGQRLSKIGQNYENLRRISQKKQFFDIDKVI